jgi:hypothetical protein
MTETLCTLGSVKLKAGTNHTALTAAQYTELINEAEGQLIADTRVNWITHWPQISGSNYVKIIQGAVSAKAANIAIMNDALAVGGLTTATTMINHNLDIYDRAVAKLKDANIFKPFGGTAIAE